MDNVLYPTLYNGCYYLSKLGLKLTHASQMGGGPLRLQAINSHDTDLARNIPGYSGFSTTFTQSDDGLSMKKASLLTHTS